MMKLPLFLAAFLCAFSAFAQNSLPKLTLLLNDPSSDLNTHVISFDISDDDSESFFVDIFISKDGGKTYESIESALLSGDVGMVNGTGIKTISILGAGVVADSDIVKITVDDFFEVNIQDIVNSVDSNNLKTYLSNVQGIRHYIAGPDKLDEVRSYIIDHFVATNRDTSISKVIYNGSNEGLNIYGFQQGVVSDLQQYFVGGHYDGVEEGPAADDNGSAVAAFMEISKVFKEYNFNYPIRYVAWDFEEQGLIGSQSFINTIPSDLDIKAYLNFEMIGYYSEKENSQELPFGFDFLFPEVYNEILNNNFKGDFLTNVGNETNSFSLMQDFENIAGTYVPELSVISVASPENGLQVPDLLRSDHAPFWFKKIPAIMLTDGANFRNKNYHTDKDVMDSLNFEFLSNNVKAAVAYLAEKAEINHKGILTTSSADYLVSTSSFPTESISISPNPARNSIYFDIEYPELEYSWKIFDINGKMVKSGFTSKGSKTQSISVSNLSEGAYLLQLNISERTIVQKFIKSE